MRMNMEHWSNDTDSGKSKYKERKTCHSATLSTNNLTRSEMGSNTSLRVERLATDRLSHGTANFKEEN
jgi:hypothetical protein